MMIRFTLAAMLVGLLALSAQATTITISAMNADTSADLEGTLGGDGTTGASSFDIDSTPSVAAVTSTTAQYTVSGVDLDGDSLFGESFTFQIEFSSPDDINFVSSRETMGLGADEEISVGESFTMAVTIISDTSGTHDVLFSGFSSVDFVSMSGVEMDLTSVSGNTVITLAGGDTDLGGLFVDPTFEYTGGAQASGTFEDWSIQFDTIPEPATAGLLGLAGLALLRRRRAA